MRRVRCSFFQPLHFVKLKSLCLSFCIKKMLWSRKSKFPSQAKQTWPTISSIPVFLLWIFVHFAKFRHWKLDLKMEILLKMFFSFEIFQWTWFKSTKKKICLEAQQNCSTPVRLGYDNSNRHLPYYPGCPRLLESFKLKKKDV